MDQSASRPTGLYVVGIGMLLFGLLGLCTQGLGAFSAVRMRSQMDELGVGGDAPLLQDFHQLQELTFVPTLVSAALGVLVAMALLVFGGLVLARVSAALVAPVILIVAGAVELGQAALSVWLQTETMALVGQDVSGLGSSSPAAAMTAAAGVTLCVHGGWALAKCAFFGASAAWLRKPEIRGLFTGPTTYGPRGD